MQKKLFFVNSELQKDTFFSHLLKPFASLPPQLVFSFSTKEQKIKLVIFEKNFFLYPSDSLYYSNVKKMINIFPVIY